MTRYIVATILLFCSATVQAAPQHRQPVCNNPDIMRPCQTLQSANPFAGVTIRVDMKRERRADVRENVVARVIGGRPAGCPHRFCGCGASLHLFGRIIPSLNLAANWLRFPRAAPAPKMAAARRGHVFVLEQHISGDTWLVHDSNSGGHRTRLHARSIAGYVIVNPTGAS